MKLSRISLFAAVLSLAVYFSNTSLHAQATRTWVSGVGDDANPGSRTAPCKTFSGAIAKTAAGGEIDVMDPGGFGTVTITKAMTIDGYGSMASISSGGVVGIFIAAGASDVVTIRNLFINGTGTGTYGIRITSAGVVRIENCVIFGGTTNAIDFQPSGANASLIIENSHIYNFGGNAVNIKPGSNAKVVIENSQLEQCGAGVHVDANATAVIKKSLISVNTGTGVDIAAGGTVTLEDSHVTLNGAGINSAGSATISGVTITGNTGAGLATVSGGSIKTYHNNQISGNNPDGNPTGSLPLR
jgi:Right handed beta helix region